MFVEIIIIFTFAPAILEKKYYSARDFASYTVFSVGVLIFFTNFKFLQRYKIFCE